MHSPAKAGCVGAQINGIPCLKANNYTLEEGEQSVFSRELKSEQHPLDTRQLC